MTPLEEVRQILTDLEGWVGCTDMRSNTALGRGIGGMSLTPCGQCEGCRFITRVREVRGLLWGS